VISPRKSELDSMVDLSLPSVYPAEKRGTMVNVTGKIQRFGSVFNGPGSSRSEYDILLAIAKKIGHNFQYYSQFKDVKHVYEEMKKEISFFQEEK
jgi:predicted molibdopterin-dependent oxidoreductase YjgC